MKVVFLQDVPNVARAGDVKEVADGYGRNFLIPRKLATLATPASIRNAEAELKTRARIQEQSHAELLELASQLDGKEIAIEAQTGAKDRLYGSITAADIADSLQNTTGLVIDKRKIELAKSIRQLGNYEVVIKLAGDITPKIMLTVTGKDKDEGTPAKKADKGAVVEEEAGKDTAVKKKGKSAAAKKTDKDATAEEKTVKSAAAKKKGKSTAAKEDG